MKPNMSSFDRIFRIGAAALIAILYFANVISGTLAVVLLVFAAVFIATGFVGSCPLYNVFGISTKPKAQVK
jgi:hypothetical protein